MHIFNIVKNRINLAIQKISGRVLEIAVEPPKSREYGDIATNAAMVLTRALGAKPMDIATKLVELLQGDSEFMSYVEKVGIVAPGFINMHLKKSSLYEFLSDLNYNGVEAFNEDLKIGNNKKINIEFVSANPTGPMHIGHARSAIYGDVTCRLLKKCDFDVTAEYYINDAGAHPCSF